MATTILAVAITLATVVVFVVAATYPLMRGED